MPGPTTTADLVQQVRSQTDEANSDTISDADILAAMNRAQRKAANTLVKQYQDMFLTFTTIASDSGAGDTYQIPQQSFGRRVHSIAIVRNFIKYPLRRVRAYDLHKFNSSILVRLPSVYAMVGRNIIIKPTPMSGVLFEIWYPAAPEPMVLPQGRVTSVNVASNYVLVDSVGSGLSTDATSLAAYVNVVDAETGYIKATMQTASIDTTNKQVVFKTAGLSAASVYNRSVQVALPAGSTQSMMNVNQNDYLCAVQGTCVPDLPDACLDFCQQFAVNDVKRRLGEPVTDEKQLLDELESDVASQWAGREIGSRIMNRARHWTR